MNHLRILNRVSLGLVAALATALPLVASSPSSGTLTDSSPPLDYTAGPFNVANPTPVIEVDSGPECNNPSQPCDDFALTVDLPAGYLAAHPNAAVKVTMGWTDAGSGNSDYDLYIYNGNVTNTDGSEEAGYSSASSSNPEIAAISPLADGIDTYTVKVVPYTPSGETVNVHVELLPGVGGGGDSGFGGADATGPGVPRYQLLLPPAGSSAEPGNGEFNIGFDPRTRRIMTMNSGPIWSVTPAEVANSSMPSSCPATWEDKSAATTNTGLDPILWTDQATGRTFASNSTAGANGVYAYSDDDGSTWVQIAAGPPSGGTDHETIGTGPYPAALAGLGTPVNHGRAVYYCSQSWPLGPATCQRSDTFGASWGPGVTAYEGNGITACEGLHGHVHVAPDGTVWLPVRGCGDHQGGAVSTDGGVTWTQFAVPGALPQSAGADPSVGIDEANTAYYCYVNNEPVASGAAPEGHVHVQVSHDGGVTWTNDVDLGASHGIKNAAHTEAVGGSSGRAACGFLGTDRAGDYQAIGFPGDWYAFIATTTDGGQHWTTVNATPNDPVQHASGIWQGGGSHTQRNLLDFNEITTDDQGRVLYGFSDGCVSAGCVAGTAPNDFVAHMRVARQTGGLGLLASHDAPEPASPNRACLAGTRDATAAHLRWALPDDGGSPITEYKVFRGTTVLQQSYIGSANGDKNQYEDTSGDPAVATYYYTVEAVNASGTGSASNAVGLTIVPVAPPENVCIEPGLSKLSDPSGDTTAVVGVTTTPAPPGADLLSLTLVQPYRTDGTVKLELVLHTDAGQSPQPPGSSWYVAMRIADPPPAKTYHYRAVHMTWNGATPTFESYVPGANNSGGVDGRFVTAGTTHPIDASSSYLAPYDTVRLVVDVVDLGLQPGDTIAGFVAGVSQTADNSVTALYDQMPDSLDYTGSYTVRNNRMCGPEAIPVAALQATPQSGCAPLTVAFDGSHSSDADTDGITAFHFVFGNGAQRTTSSPTTSYTYDSAGSFLAALDVTDDRGTKSTNTAQAAITVDATPPQPTVTAPARAEAGETDLVASVPAQDGAQYAWSISNGTITGGQGTNEITFSAGTAGDLTVSVTVTAGSCSAAPARASVEVFEPLFSNGFEEGRLVWDANQGGDD